LVDGRRVAVTAISALNGKVFVDVSQIPASAIDRIEVLSDGSSAVYGSDAVGGVVNIILKSNYDGAEVGARFGTTAGGYNEREEHFTWGKSKRRPDRIGHRSGGRPLYPGAGRPVAKFKQSNRSQRHGG
jgi:iron complex outermembrane receptor protein